jgi:hypothetical protein
MAFLWESKNCNGIFQNRWIVVVYLQLWKIVMVPIQITQKENHRKNHCKFQVEDIRSKSFFIRFMLTFYSSHRGPVYEKVYKTREDLPNIWIIWARAKRTLITWTWNWNTGTFNWNNTTHNKMLDCRVEVRFCTRISAASCHYSFAVFWYSLLFTSLNCQYSFVMSKSILSLCTRLIAASCHYDFAVIYQSSSNLFG